MRVGRGGVGAILAAIATLAVATVASAEEKIKIGLDLTISGYHAGWLEPRSWVTSSSKVSMSRSIGVTARAIRYGGPTR